MSNDYDVEISLNETLEMNVLIKQTDNMKNEAIFDSNEFNVSEIQTNTLVFDPEKPGTHSIEINNQKISVKVKDPISVPDSGISINREKSIGFYTGRGAMEYNGSYIFLNDSNNNTPKKVDPSDFSIVEIGGGSGDTALGLERDGSRLATGSQSGNKVASYQQSDLTNISSSGLGDSGSSCFAYNGSVYSGYRGAKVDKRDIGSLGNVNWTYSNHTNNNVRAIQLGPNQNYGFSGGDGGMIAKWDLNGNIQNTSTFHSTGLKYINFDNNGYGYSGDINGNIHKWNHSDISDIKSTSLHSDQITQIAIDRDGNFGYSSSRDGYIKQWNLSDLSVVDTISRSSRVGGLCPIDSTDTNLYFSDHDGNIGEITR